MAAHSRGPDDGAGLDPVDRLTGPSIFADWLRSQTVEDAPDLRFQIELFRLRKLAEARHESLADVIDREHGESITALIHTGLIDEADLPKRRRRRTTRKENI